MSNRIPINVPGSSNPLPDCPLCGAASEHFTRDARRDYFRCPSCSLVFVVAGDRVSRAEEKACYDQHQNDPNDQRYRQFLNRLFAPLHERLPPRSRGLDFGSGPGPTLSLMFHDAGHVMRIYDPFYAPDMTALTDTYDFITASEVVEHLHRPREELERLWSLLRPGGWLAVMTKRTGDLDAFNTWHYKKDPTHVVFFAEATFIWLANHWQAELTLADRDVALLHKPG